MAKLTTNWHHAGMKFAVEAGMIFAHQLVMNCSRRLGIKTFKLTAITIILIR